MVVEQVRQVGGGQVTEDFKCNKEECAKGWGGNIFLEGQG